MTDQEIEVKNLETQIEILEDKVKELQEDLSETIEEKYNLQSQIREFEDDLDNKEWDKNEFTDIFDKEIQDAILYEKPIHIDTYMNRQVFISVI